MQRSWKSFSDATRQSYQKGRETERDFKTERHKKKRDRVTGERERDRETERERERERERNNRE
jgi:hypothetical protein